MYVAMIIKEPIILEKAFEQKCLLRKMSLCGRLMSAKPFPWERKPGSKKDVIELIDPLIPRKKQKVLKQWFIFG